MTTQNLLFVMVVLPVIAFVLHELYLDKINADYQKRQEALIAQERRIAQYRSNMRGK